MFIYLFVVVWVKFCLFFFLYSVTMHRRLSPLSQLPKPLMAIRRLVVSLISDQVYFTFLYRHTKNNIHNREGGRKENKQTQTWVSSKCKKGEVCNTFLAFCELSWAYIWAKFPQCHQECWLIFSSWLSQHLRPHIPAVACSLLVTALFCPLLCFASFSWLSASPNFCQLPCSLPWSLLLWDVSSLVLFRSCGRSRTQSLCVGFTPKQTKGSSDLHSYPHNKCPISCHNSIYMQNYFWRLACWRRKATGHKFQDEFLYMLRTEGIFIDKQCYLLSYA